ncbi:MAG TPA: hypothetical protein EYP58_00175 [bacterium (Candidatus Stahlbacteria)]|nr:hypothetical protein [Candidatus Stahlbacteria bacterium]
MKYFSLIVVCFSLASGYLPSSFRNISTANIFEDDYDLMLDPGRIPEIEGYRLYTNLSNLVTGLERPFIDASVNYFLFGGSGLLKGNKYGGAILDNYSMNNPLPTGLLTREGDTIYGEGEVVNTEWQDTDGDGSYDYVINSEEYREAWDRDQDMNFYLGVAVGGERRFGLAFIHEDNRNTTIDPLVNYKIENSETTLIDDRFTYLLGDTLQTVDQTNGSSNSLLFSGWFGSDRAINFQLGFGMVSSDSLIEAGGYYFEDRNPGGDTLDYLKVNTADTFHLPYSGFEIPIRLGMLQHHGGGSQSEYYFDFRYTTLSVGGGGERHNYTATDSTCRPGMVNAFDSVYTQYSGSRGGYTAGLWTRHRFVISDRFAFGLGLALSNSSITDELIDSTSQTGNYTYDDGDGVSTANDSTVTYDEMQNWKKKKTSTIRSISIPVGLEFKVINPVTFRLGARHTTTYYDIKTTENLMAFDPRRTRTDYGDGTYYETIDDEQLQSGTSETDSPTIHSTDYYYGLGIMIGKNLQLDLMYFNNLVNLANWRLSATLKF